MSRRYAAAESPSVAVCAPDPPPRCSSNTVRTNASTASVLLFASVRSHKMHPVAEKTQARSSMLVLLAAGKR